MARINSLYLRGAKQRLAGAVFYQLNGQTIARELAASVSNPQTAAQQQNRVTLANLVSFYRVSRAWNRKSFQSKPSPTWSDYNAFVSANKASTPVYLTKQMAAGGACVVAPYVITRGTLSPVSWVNQTASNALLSNLNVDESLMGEAATATIATFSASILANNNGLQAGDQISLVLYYQNVVEDLPRVFCRYYEVILSTTDTALLSSRMPSEIFDFYEIDANTHVVGLATDTARAAGIAGVAIILSRDRGGNVQVSSQEVVMIDSTIYNRYTTPAARELAIASYTTRGDEVFLAAGYQNGSNSAAVQNSILSVIDKNGAIHSPGSVAWTYNEIEGLAVQLSSEPVDYTSASVQVTTTTNGTDFSTGTLIYENYDVPAQSIYFQAGEPTPPTPGQVTEVRLSVDGTTYVAQFEFVFDGGEVTP